MNVKGPRGWILIVVAVGVENVEASDELSIQILVRVPFRGLIVSDLMVAHWIRELCAFVPCVQLFRAVIVADRCRFSEGICEAQRHVEEL